MDKLFDEEYQDYLKIRRGEKVPDDGSKDIDYKLRDWAMELSNIKPIDDLVVSFNDNQVSVESVPKDLSGSMKEIDLKPSNSFFKDGVPESLKNLRIKYRKDGFEILENF